jgi:hypothetical protein
MLNLATAPSDEIQRMDRWEQFAKTGLEWTRTLLERQACQCLEKLKTCPDTDLPAARARWLQSMAPLEALDAEARSVADIREKIARGGGKKG